jgi:signal peptidase I
MSRPALPPLRRVGKAPITGIVGGVAALSALVLAWSFFAPTQVGGGTSYAIIVGSSMEPGLHRGDLAVVRAQSSYRPGDVVLYDSRELGTKVLHRIVRVDGGRFVLKGDNNSFLDAEQPTQAQILGTLWIRAPAVGRATEWLRQPSHSALLVGLVTLIALGGGLGTGAAVRRASQPPRARVARSAPGRVVTNRPPGPVVTTLAAGVVGCVVLAFLSFGRPLTRLETVEAAYAHQGRFEYEAGVPRSPVYPDGHVGTGEPVFLRLVPRLRVSFTYKLESQQPVDAQGTIALDARLSDGRGWERVLPLAHEERFSAGEATASGVLDLAWIERIVEDVRDLTGSAQTAYTVAVLPRVQVTGTIGSERVDTTFAPSLSFDLGDLRLQPSFDAGEGVSPAAPRQPGSGTRTIEAQVSLGSLSLPVATARRASLLGFAVLALLGGLVLALRHRRPGGDEHPWIDARYGHLIVPVSRPADHWANLVDVNDFDALVRLADRCGRLILHVVDDRSYVVEDGGHAYRYRSPAPEPAPMVWPSAAGEPQAGR